MSSTDDKNTSDDQSMVVDEAVALKPNEDDGKTGTVKSVVSGESSVVHEAEPADDKKTYTLRSSDGQYFVVDEAAVSISKTIWSLIEDGVADDNNSIPLPNVAGDVLAKVIDYCKKQVVFDKASKSAADKDSREKHLKEVKVWEKDFADVDRYMLFSLIMAANYLNIDALLEFSSQAAADRIRNMKVEEVREFFDIENDFTEEEEARVRAENAWAFE